MVLNYLEDEYSPDDWVLDLGSKDGADMAALSAETIALDLNFTAVEADTEYILSDGTRSPFKSETFDFILCNQVFEHVPDTEALVEEMARILKPGGEVLITFPNRLAPTKPHPTPRWASYLPQSVGEYILTPLVSQSVVEYYKNHESMLSPVKARYLLSKHFSHVDYVTFEHKARYHEERLKNNTLDSQILASIQRISYDLAPYISRVENIPVVGDLPELLYPGVRYVCRK